MNRNEYLTRCRECAKIKAGTQHRSWHLIIPEELWVFYDGRKYIPHAYRIWFDKEGNVIQDAELLDGFSYACAITVDLKSVKGTKE